MAGVVSPTHPSDSLKTFAPSGSATSSEPRLIQSRQPTAGFQVLCRYDFDSEDPSLLDFKRGDLLHILQTEPNGWWGAERPGGIGWIPASYVVRLDDSLARSLRDVRDELRFFEYETETRWRNAPVRNLADPLQSSGLDEHQTVGASIASSSTAATAPFSPYESPPLTGEDGGYTPDSEDSESEASPLTEASPVYSREDNLPFGEKRIEYVPRLVDKPMPPTPSLADQVDPPDKRRLSDPLANSSAHVLRPVPTISHEPERNIPSESDSDHMGSNDYSPWKQPKQARGITKVAEVLGDGDAQAYYNAKVAQAAFPWYLLPVHVGEEIKFDSDDSIRAGTLEALIERLTMDHLRSNLEMKYRRTFLTTFKSFTTADKLFESLLSLYSCEPPPGLNRKDHKEESDWIQRKCRPTQRRVLNVLSDWFERYGLIEDDPHLIPQLKDFLPKASRISHDSPTTALIAKNISQSLDRALLNKSANPSPSLQKPPKSRGWKMPKKGDGAQDDPSPSDLAHQLTLFEAKLYAKIRPQECLAWPKSPKSPNVQNLAAFCTHSNRLAAWVKHSILSKQGLGPRADTVNRWIRIAEKCRLLNNISSTFTIVAALSSTVVERLHLTWAHVVRKSELGPLQRLAQPNNNFKECRDLLRSIVVPCVPFIGMNLTDLTHINDQYPDTISVPSSPDYPQGLNLIHFSKRQSTVDVIDFMLRHQERPYQFLEKTHIQNFIEQQLNASNKDEQWFWLRSQELQQAEIAHADIKRNLEAAGF